MVNHSLNDASTGPQHWSYACDGQNNAEMAARLPAEREEDAVEAG